MSLKSIDLAERHSDELVIKASREAFNGGKGDLDTAALRLKNLPSVTLPTATAILAAFDVRIPHYSDEFVMVFYLAQAHTPVQYFTAFCKAAYDYLKQKDSPFKRMEELEMACWSVGTSPAFLAKHFPGVNGSGVKSIEQIIPELPRSPKPPNIHRNSSRKGFISVAQSRPYCPLSSLGRVEKSPIDEQKEAPNLRRSKRVKREAK